MSPSSESIEKYDVDREVAKFFEELGKEYLSRAKGVTSVNLRKAWTGEKTTWEQNIYSTEHLQVAEIVKPDGEIIYFPFIRSSEVPDRYEKFPRAYDKKKGKTYEALPINILLLAPDGTVFLHTPTGHYTYGKEIGDSLQTKNGRILPPPGKFIGFKDVGFSRNRGEDMQLLEKMKQQLKETKPLIS